MIMYRVLAFDLGASNGRLTAVELNDHHLSLHEVHRFDNKMVEENGHMYWDYSYLFYEMLQGIRKAVERWGKDLHGIGIDTWGVDHGFINEQGKLLANPLSYRDTYSEKTMKKALKSIDGYELFKRTGNEVATINTLFQLMAVEERWPERLKQAKHILFMPNLLNYHLTGVAKNEFTIASTSQMLNQATADWDVQLIKQLMKENIQLTDISMPHQIIGNILPRYGPSHIPVILTPGHDTACALSALPIQNQSAVFVSLGTWALIGVEVDQPIVTQSAYEKGFTNEGTSEGKIRFQKNSTGFWILQTLRKEWKSEGVELTYEEEKRLVKQASMNQTIIDLDDEMFFNPRSMNEAIVNYCKQTNQQIPKSIADLLSCVLESMAIQYAQLIQQIEQEINREVTEIYIGGGGSRNEVLCQLIADAANKLVYTGPTEASAIGNGLSQLRAIGAITSLEEGRKLVKQSFEMNVYKPIKMEV